MKSIAIIPARGGSKGIPRKCLRPVAGKPMIHYAIKASLACASIDRVVVSTDDEEIAMLAERFGAQVIMRPAELADDVTTLDPVIAHAVAAAEERFNERYDIVYTVQPTSPLVQPHDLELAGEHFAKDPGIQTVLSVVDDRHLCWTVHDGEAVPRYERRVNRQQLPPNFRETGAIIACRREQLQRGTRIGTRVALLEMPPHRSFDIDSFADLYLCESILDRKIVVFAVVGYPEVGLGHAVRALMLAHALVQYDVRFVCEHSSELAARHIRQYNYPVEICPDGGLADTVLAHGPDMVVNDVLDTDPAYMQRLAASGCRIVNFEDLGSGTSYADLVVNALYAESEPRPNIVSGPEYFCLRDEFLYLQPKHHRDDVRRVLVTFGGVDEGDLTARIVAILAPVCAPHGIVMDVITGPGYAHHASLQATLEQLDAETVRLVGSTVRISDYMYDADIAITSGGRTVLELASLGVPTMVICQNVRETLHRYASRENGVLNLGFRGKVADDVIRGEFERLLSDAALRTEMSTRNTAVDLSGGKQRVVRLLVDLLQVAKR